MVTLATKSWSFEVQWSREMGPLLSENVHLEVKSDLECSVSLSIWGEPRSVYPQLLTDFDNKCDVRVGGHIETQDRSSCNVSGRGTREVPGGRRNVDPLPIKVGVCHSGSHAKAAALRPRSQRGILKKGWCH